jgi:hypothetical protein
MKPSAERSSPSKFKDFAPGIIEVPELPQATGESFQGQVSPIVELAHSFLLNSASVEAEAFAGFGYVPTTLSWADQVDQHNDLKAAPAVTFHVPTLQRDADVTVLSKRDVDEEFVTVDPDDDFQPSPSPGVGQSIPSYF